MKVAMGLHKASMGLLTRRTQKRPSPHFLSVTAPSSLTRLHAVSTDSGIKASATPAPQPRTDNSPTCPGPASAAIQPMQELREVVLLDVGGMKCAGCSAAVKRLLSKEPGVELAAVNLMTETAAVTVKGLAAPEAAALVERAAAKVTAAGFPTKLRSREGGSLLDTAQEADRRKQEELTRSLGDVAVAWALTLVCCAHHASHLFHSMGMHGIAHGPLMQFLGNPAFSAAMASVALLGPGRKLLVDGFQSLAAGNPNMNSLIAMGASASFSTGVASQLIPGLATELGHVGFLEEPVMLLAFVLLGRTLETRARLKATSDLRALAGLLPAETQLVLDASGKSDAEALSKADAMRVPTTSIRTGDLVRVLPGERIPVDGVVVSGLSAVDESLLTGESALVPKQEGTAVTAGSLNWEGPLVIRAQATGSDSVLSNIGRLVAEAQSREAPIQRLADTVAGKFCYGVMTASLATLAFWATAGPSLFPGALDAVAAAEGSSALLLAIKLAVDVLVVACPCALGLATPTAVLVASSLGARKGLLIRGGDVLERLSLVDTVVLDKTGTLTEGKLKLSSVQTLVPGLEAEGLLAMVASVEASTRHPIAQAILEEVGRRGVPVPPCTDAVTEPGYGALGTVQGLRVAVGTQQLLLRDAPPGEMADRIAADLRDLEAALRSSSVASTSAPSRLSPSHPTFVYVGFGGAQVAGAMALADSLREDAAPTVEALRRLGCRVMIMSGDNPEAVRGAALLAGIDPAEAWGGLKPQDKADMVEKLRKSGRRVAMVGDGVNDAIALAAADVGIALSGGLDVAGDAASVVLMGNRLGQVVEAVELGRATLSKIRQNLWWALAYNAIGIPLAAGVLLPTLGIALNPSVAGGMMAMSSIAVVTNSLLLRQGQSIAPLAPQMPVQHATQQPLSARDSDIESQGPSQGLPQGK